MNDTVTVTLTLPEEVATAIRSEQHVYGTTLHQLIEGLVEFGFREAAKRNRSMWDMILDAQREARS